MMSHRSSRLPARPRRGLPWLAPRRCKARQGQRRRCQGNQGSLCRAGRWRPTPSRPPSCDTRRRSPASQTPQTLDPERKDRDPLRWEPVERRGRSQWRRHDDEWLIIISNRSMFPHRLDQTVSRASFLCQLSAELRGNSEGGVRSVRGRSYNTTSHMTPSDTQQRVIVMSSHVNVNSVHPSYLMSLQGHRTRPVWVLHLSHWHLMDETHLVSL